MNKTDALIARLRTDNCLCLAAEQAATNLTKEKQK
jgi:hypothetical protein